MKKKGLLIFLMAIVCASMYATSPPYLTSPQNQVSFTSNQTFSWVSNEAIKTHELKIYNCNYNSGPNSQSIFLDDYEIFLTKDVGVNYLVSGLACGVENKSPLVACSSGSQQLNAYGLSMTFINFNWLANFPVDTYSGITHISNGNYILAESSQNYIYYIPYVANSGTFIGYSKVPKYKLNLGAGNGIQGVTYNPINNKVYVAQEKSPFTLHEFSAFSAPDFEGTISLKVPFDMAGAASKWGIKSINGLFHLGQDLSLNGTEAGNHLLVLSADSKVVIECDMKGNEISRLNLGNSIVDANGIAYYSGTLYIATKSNINIGRKAKMYLFRNENHKGPIVTLGTSVFSKKGISGESYNGVSSNLFSNDKTYCWEIIGTDNEGKAVKSTKFSFKIGNPILGCTNPNACNYNPNATQDDNSCEYNSCAPVISSITSPSTGQKFYPGNTINIKWDDNFNENVKIELQSITDSRVVTYSTASDGSYSYTIPNNIKPATNYRIVIQKSGDNSVVRYSGFFTIEDALFINIYAPTNQSKFEIGEKVNVRWEHNLSGTFNVSLYKGNSFLTSVVNNTYNTEYVYQIPDNFSEGTNYRFLVKSNSTNVTDFSPYITFEKVIPPDTPYIVVTEPKQNTQIDLGQEVTIKWVDNFTEPVDIFLFEGTRFVKDIAKNVYGNSYKYKFEQLDQANNYNIYIRSTKNANLSDYGPYFSLLETSIIVNSPYAGNIYKAGNYISVRWEDASSNYVSIKFYENNNLISTIEESVINNGAYAFKAPSVKRSNNYNVVVTSLNDNSKKGTSGMFTINPREGINNITLFNGSLGTNKKYVNNDNFTITWSDNLSSDLIIQLFKDSKWISGLTGATKADGVEKITLPNRNLPLGGNYQIRILNLVDQRIYAFSDSFSIVANNGNRTIQFKDNEDVGLLDVYPNPTKGIMKIDIPLPFKNNNQLQLSIFNAAGQAIFKKDYIDLTHHKLELNLKNEPKGLYFINLTNNKLSYKAKILID